MEPNLVSPRHPFPPCEDGPIGFYPIVASFSWVEKLGQWGVHTVQLRMKNAPIQERIAAYKISIPYAKEKNIRLFINDDWELAIELNAYGVHLGQEDLNAANILRIAHSGLRLGVSTHNSKEVSNALVLKPSYIACGPIFSTSSKEDAALPIGVDQLLHYCKQIKPYPVVAIGGITEKEVPHILGTGVEGVAVIKALKDAPSPEAFCKKWMKLCKVC